VRRTRHRRATQLHQRPHHRGGWQGAPRQAARADYLLYYRRDYPLAVVEAKEIGLPAETGVQQARDYAEMLGAQVRLRDQRPRIIEIDYTTGTEREVDRYATPDELFARLTASQLTAGLPRASCWSRST
jgi:type I site-specific restriction endonuclease